MVSKSVNDREPPVATPSKRGPNRMGRISDRFCKFYSVILFVA